MAEEGTNAVLHPGEWRQIPTVLGRTCTVLGNQVLVGTCRHSQTATFDRTKVRLTTAEREPPPTTSKGSPEALAVASHTMIDVGVAERVVLPHRHAVRVKPIILHDEPSWPKCTQVGCDATPTTTAVLLAATATTAKEEAAPSTSVARQRWDADQLMVARLTDLLYTNRIAEAEEVCRQGAETPVPTGEGVRDLRGAFAMMAAMFSVMHGLARGAKDQLKTSLPRMLAADALLAQAEPWLLQQLMRSCCVATIGGLQCMQYNFVTGGVLLFKSYRMLKPAVGGVENLGADCAPHERPIIRSLGLYLQGVKQVLTPMAHPTAAKMLKGMWAGDQPRGLQLLRTCIAEGGVFAPGAMDMLLAYHCDGPKECCCDVWSAADFDECDALVRRAAARWGDGTLVFAPREATLLGFKRRPRDAAARLARLRLHEPTVAAQPLMVSMLLLGEARFLCGALDLSGAAARARAAVAQLAAAGKHNTVPTASLCCVLLHLAAGEEGAARAVLGELEALKARCAKKKWSKPDKQSLALCAKYQQLLLSSTTATAAAAAASTATEPSARGGSARGEAAGSEGDEGAEAVGSEAPSVEASGGHGGGGDGSGADSGIGGDGEPASRIMSLALLDVAERLLWQQSGFAFMDAPVLEAFLARVDSAVRAGLLSGVDETARARLLCALACDQACFAELSATRRAELAGAALRHCAAGLAKERSFGGDAKRHGTASMLHLVTAQAHLRTGGTTDALAALQRAAAAPKAKEGPAKYVEFGAPLVKRACQPQMEC